MAAVLRESRDVQRLISRFFHKNKHLIIPLSRNYYLILKRAFFSHQGAFPARLKKVLIVGAPVWFRVPYNLLSLLLKEKLRERVKAPSLLLTVNTRKISAHE